MVVVVVVVVECRVFGGLTMFCFVHILQLQLICFFCPPKTGCGMVKGRMILFFLNPVSVLAELCEESETIRAKSRPEDGVGTKNCSATGQNLMLWVDTW